MAAITSKNDEAPPAERLLGLALPDGWTVVERILPVTGHTGSFFSAGYLAKHADERTAFLKALDFSRALQYEDPAREMQRLTGAFNFERDILDLCKSKGMSKIVRAIGSGVVAVDTSPIGRVQYLLFETAACDLRSMLGQIDSVSIAWCVGALHQAAVGVSQLHGAQIAHQDLKPSNVLMFGANGKNAKLSDLGCASKKGSACPRDDQRVPGAWSYAPPELVYGQLSSDWQIRRISADLFQLGNLAAFLFTNTTVSQLLSLYTPEQYRPIEWRGSYREVMSVIRDAYGRAIEHLETSMSGDVEREVLRLIKELCEPDPEQRGDVRHKGTWRQYSVEPYVSWLGNLSARAAYCLRKASRK
jgi:serine/threonine protein kinase